MKHSDVLVVGSGIAGVIAAITAAKKGASVTVISQGAGIISIGSAAVDFLGYDSEKLIRNSPFEHLQNLPANHPYSILGADFIKNSFHEFMKICSDNGLDLTIAHDGNNKTAVSVMGTLRPTYISSVATDAGAIFKSKKIAVVGVEWLKDCQPKLAITQLQQYKFMQDACFTEIVLKSPFGKTHRAINCLDLARYADTVDGQKWLHDELSNLKNGGYDLVLIPPVCGVSHHKKVYSSVVAEGLNIVEMVSIPPGVGGERMRLVLMSEAKKLGVTFVECCYAAGANVNGNKCLSLTTRNGDETGFVETKYYADHFIIASGGLLGGGIEAGIDRVYEKIFGIELDCPKRAEDRTCVDVFGNHPFAYIGVMVSDKMRPVAKSGVELYSNVYFAGKILGGYDFAKEKSGYGVAISTAVKAALVASEKGFQHQGEN